MKKRLRPFLLLFLCSTIQVVPVTSDMVEKNVISESLPAFISHYLQKEFRTYHFFLVAVLSVYYFFGYKKSTRKDHSNNRIQTSSLPDEVVEQKKDCLTSFIKNHLILCDENKKKHEQEREKQKKYDVSCSDSFYELIDNQFNYDTEKELIFSVGKKKILFANVLSWDISPKGKILSVQVETRPKVRTYGKELIENGDIEFKNPVLVSTRFFQVESGEEIVAATRDVLNYQYSDDEDYLLIVSCCAESFHKSFMSIYLSSYFYHFLKYFYFSSIPIKYQLIDIKTKKNILPKVSTLIDAVFFENEKLVIIDQDGKPRVFVCDKNKNRFNAIKYFLGFSPYKEDKNSTSFLHHNPYPIFRYDSVTKHRSINIVYGKNIENHLIKENVEFCHFVTPKHLILRTIGHQSETERVDGRHGGSIGKSLDRIQAIINKGPSEISTHIFGKRETVLINTDSFSKECNNSIEKSIAMCSRIKDSSKIAVLRKKNPIVVLLDGNTNTYCPLETPDLYGEFQ